MYPLRVSRKLAAISMTGEKQMRSRRGLPSPEHGRIWIHRVGQPPADGPARWVSPELSFVTRATRDSMAFARRLAMHRSGVPAVTTQVITRVHPAYQAYQLLHLAFVLVPVVAGADKFLRLLADWDTYLSPTYARLSPLGVRETMLVVGATEVLAGLIVAIKPRIGAYIVALWLVGIIVNLILLRGHLDVGLRDVGLVLGAVALARLGDIYDRKDANHTVVVHD